MVAEMVAEVKERVGEVAKDGGRGDVVEKRRWCKS